MNRTLTAAVCAAAVLTVACGKSEAEKKAEEAAKQAEQAAKSGGQAAQGAAQGLEAMAKSLEALAAGKTPDGQKVEPVKIEELVAMLPQLEGWEQQKPEGERMTAPFPTARAEANYTKGDASISIEIIDSSFSQLLLTPVAMFLQSGYAKESSSGYEKSATVNGQPGWEKWDGDRKRGEVNALVGKRYLVSIEGSNVSDINPLKDAASRMDFNRLAALK
jgi:hypothetical protein